MQRIIILMIVVLSNLLGSQVANAENYLQSRSYFNDKSNQLSIDQIEQQQFTPYRDVLTAGYQSGTYWIKLKIAPSVQALVLKIRPVFTEEVELFDPASPQRKPMVGNKHPLSASEFESVSYNFLLKPEPEVRDVYLRIKSLRSYLVKVEVMDMTEYQKQDRIELLVYTGYCSFTFLLALWLLVTWLMHRELVLGAFTLQQFIACLHTLFHSGLVKFFFDRHLDPTITNQLFSTLVVIYPLVGIWANRCLLQEYGLKKFYRYGFNFLLMLSVAVVLLHLSTDMSLTFNLNSLLVFIAILFFLISSVFGIDLKISAFRADALSINTLRGFYAFNVALWVMAILPLQGVLATGTLALHSLHVYSILSGLVFFFLLQHRAKGLLQLETIRASALKVEADQERQQREEQAMLMAMLSHEIKTPLSVLKLVVDEKVIGTDLEGHANRAVSNINFIVDRCLQLDRLDAKAILANKRLLGLNLFLKKIIAEYKAEKRVSIQCADELSAQTDPEILRVVVSNLLENTLKYSPASSMIWIDVQQYENVSQSGFKITFTNEKGLMGGPDSEHVFKKYYRNASATKISGSGLGLYLVHELMKVLGGSIEYQPQNKRIVFILWIHT